MTELGTRAILPDKVHKKKPEILDFAKNMVWETLVKERCSNIRIETEWRPAETVTWGDGTTTDLPDRYEITGYGDVD